MGNSIQAGIVGGSLSSPLARGITIIITPFKAITETGRIGIISILQNGSFSASLPSDLQGHCVPDNKRRFLIPPCHESDQVFVTISALANAAARPSHSCT